MHQDLVRPGMLVAHDLQAQTIADLTSKNPAITACAWREIYIVDRGVPPSWPLAEQLIAAGAEGALVPSVQNPGGHNLVLWRWHDASSSGDGAALTLLDPEAALTGR